MRSEAKYTPEKLKEIFLETEKQIGRTPKGSELVQVGLPDVGYYKRAYGTYGNFLRTLGRAVPEKVYRQKQNPKRFFYPQEWIKVINSIDNEDHKFWLEMLLHTGTRTNECRNIKVEHINLDKEFIFIAKAKGGRDKGRTIQISTYLKNRIAKVIKTKKLQSSDYIMANLNHEKRQSPSNQFLSTLLLKGACKKAGLADWQDFSCHNIRKTTEMWLIALGINHLAVIAHQGHTIDVASAHYVSTSLFSAEDKTLIKSILDNLLQK